MPAKVLVLAQHLQLVVEIARSCCALQLFHYAGPLPLLLEPFQLLDVSEKLCPRALEPVVPGGRQPGSREWMDRRSQLRKDLFGRAEGIAG